ncbi:hypothetical protein [Fontivita pretiosa]|uniref:hypothetical protein n=1 Tax=Fontivita pretiosa TaxID=2989684 RepID=UPI003D16C8B9
MGIIALIAITVFAPKRLVYDEPWYLGTVPLLREQGLSIQFLRSLPGPAGPLYTFVHFAFEPFTGLRAPGVRLVNLGMFGLLIAFTAWLCRLRGDDVSIAFSLVGLPLLWKMSGLAMTEMPAMSLFMAGLAALWASMQRSGHRQLILSVLAGACFGIAALGRQPLLVVIVAIPILWQSRQHALPLLAAMVVPLIITVPVFWAWKGLVPPQAASTASGWAPGHAALALAYAAALVLILAPGFFKLTGPLLVCAAAMSIGQILLWPVRIIPMVGIARGVLPASFLAPFSVAVVAVMLLAGWLLALSIVRRMARYPEQRWGSFLGLTCLLLLISAAKVTHQFSPRYAAVAAPLLVLITAEHSPQTPAKAARLAIGIAIGGASLTSFFFFTH